jgi:arylsulfatase A-like enzyme
MAVLCDRGVCFSQAITAATYTTASVASVLTGLYPAAHGVRSLGYHRLPADCLTLASVLSEAGYTTCAHLTGPLSHDMGFDRGFQHFHYRDRRQTAAGDWGTHLLRELRTGPTEPWFMLVHLWALHHPPQVPARFASGEYGRCAYEKALSGIDHFIGELLDSVDPDTTAIVLTSDHGERLETGSRAMMTRWFKTAGRWVLRRSGPVGRVANWLKESRLTPNSLLHVGALHGTDVTDVLARVPLAIAAPGDLPAGVTVTDQVRTIDLAPTVLELLEVDASLGRFQGESLLPVVRGPAGEPRPALIEAYAYPRRSTDFDSSGIVVGLRTPEWKLVFRPHARSRGGHLYDLVTDPAERRNAVRRQPDVVGKLRAMAEQILSDSERLAYGTSVLSDSERQDAADRLRDLGYM